jgi:integrase/recombinase XerD
MKPITVIILDTRRKKETGKYPVKLRVTFLRKQHYYPVGGDLTEDDFLLMQNPDTSDKKVDRKTKNQLNEYRVKCNAIQVRAIEIIDKINEFSFRVFENKFYQHRISSNDLIGYYEEIIQRKKKNNQIGTAANYTNSLTSLKKFCPKLQFNDITVDFLKEYERWLLTNKKSISTVGIYLRPLRAVLNEAIAEGLITKENSYPFGKRKYQIPASRNIKKALSLDEIGKIFRYKAIEGTWKQRARDYFIFSYLGNGINMKDIALLKLKDIDGEYIRFSRAKTLYTNRTGSMPISIYLSTEMKEIIKRWKNSDSTPESLLFPIIGTALNPEKERETIKQFVKMINKYIKLIAIEVGINKPITTYYARHSFATILRRSGASTELISESLGHSSLKTTYSYLDSFEDEKKKEMLTALTNF